METRLQLTGWQAAVVGALILGVITYQCLSRIQTVNDAGRETVRAWLVREYQGRGVRQEVRDYLRRKAGEDPGPAQQAMPEPAVVITSLAAHGSKDSMVVRVQMKVNDGPPPDGRPVRYVFLDHHADGRWVAFAQSDALHYYYMLLIPAFSRHL